MEDLNINELLEKAQNHLIERGAVNQLLSGLIMNKDIKVVEDNLEEYVDLAIKLYKKLSEKYA